MRDRHAHGNGQALNSFKDEASSDESRDGAYRPVPDWAGLRRGDAVELRRGDALVRRGTVEDLTPDSTMLWLSQYGAENREIIHREDGYELWSKDYPAV